MKIAMVHPHDIENSPWTIRIIKLAEALIDMGHEVEVFYFLEPERRDLGIVTHKLESFSFPLHGLNKNHWFGNTKLFYRLCREIDILHIQKCFSHVILPTLIAAYLTRTPVHYDWDDWEEGITRDYLGNHIFTSLVKFNETLLPRMVDSISVSSEALRLKAFERACPEKVIVKVPVGADLNEFSPDREPDHTIELPPGEGPLVLYAGQIEGANYASLFLKAAAAVKKREPKTRFLVVGGGFRLAELHTIAQDLDLGDAICFTGYVLHSEIPAILALADICVATFEDNLITRCKSPLKIVEYMGMAKAIIASDVGEVHHMLEGRAVLVPPGDAQAIAQAIITLVHSPDKGKELGKKAREAVLSTYNWRVSAENLLMAYEQNLKPSSMESSSREISPGDPRCICNNAKSHARNPAHQISGSQKSKSCRDGSCARPQ
ncbi:glycosyltransferase family 4 protein, partial [bacterium]|nr:glycosyltransferase family 4 protein [bacterium]